jgi:NAD(P)-dependent dehydrogenase (short-subunit alcohol dehydrogenase family)
MGSSNLFSLKGKVIVVTGGTGILGGGFVKGIADAGGIAVILGRNAEVGQQRADEINASGGTALVSERRCA